MSLGDFNLHFLFNGVSYLTALFLLALGYFRNFSACYRSNRSKTLIVKKKINLLSQDYIT